MNSDELDLTRITPMMQQYLEQKRAFPDCLLLFRLGDFYELFFEDAKIASRELELTLTARDCGQEERAPMCGVPYHAVDSYIGRLISRGYKVAICEQTEDPAQAKGLVRRDVVRVITPGTVTDPMALDERSNNYILALYRLSLCFGLAVADLTTGDFLACSLIQGAPEEKAQAEIARWNPAEIIVPQSQVDDPLPARHHGLVTARPDAEFSLEQVRRFLPEASGRDMQQPLWSQAAAALMSYLTETQRVTPGHLKPVVLYQAESYLRLDPNARRNLEITATLRDGGRRGSLLWAIDQTVTASGGRLLRRWLEEPLLSPAEISRRQDSVQTLLDGFMLRQELRGQLDGLYDLERLAGRIGLGSVNARDLTAVRHVLRKLPPILDLLQAVADPGLQTLRDAIDPLTELADQLEAAISEDAPAGLREGGLIREGYDADVDRLRTAARDGRQWILDLEAREREQTGIRSLKIGYNRVFGYYLDVTKANLALVPEHYQRRQTLANSERFITPELKRMEDEIVGAEQKSIALEYELFCAMRDQASACIRELQQNGAALAELDVLSGLAEQAQKQRYCRPVVDLGGLLEIRQGRHPVVERVLGAGQFVANDLEMDLAGERTMILTGPNMSGKSTYLRQNALIVLLAQMGSFVPAQSARVGIVDRIFTRIGASDDLASGQSTFLVEMNEVAQILHEATPRSLLILDEIGRGTSTYDGLSIAWAVIETIADRQTLGARALFATHYHELTDLAGRLPGVFNRHVAVREEAGSIVFLHHIVPGGTDNSYGIEVARLAGVPQAVIDRAAEILAGLEASQADRQKQRLRRTSRPMEGQVDLFAASQSLRQTDRLLERLADLETHMLTPLDALNVLDDLRRQALRLRGETQSGQRPGSGVSASGTAPAADQSGENGEGVT